MESIKKPEEWYSDADAYWTSVAANENGMLGGLLLVHEPDIRASKNFLNQVLKTVNSSYHENEGKLPTIDKTIATDPNSSGCSEKPGQRELVALDCGAGIGRVTKFLLSEYAIVDMVEQSAKFVQAAETEYLLDLIKKQRVSGCYVCGLQDFVPTAGRYDIIWCQWVLGHLTTPDLVSFFKNCVRGLTPNGVIVVKENVCVAGIVVDEVDSSVTRSSQILQDVFSQAGLKIILKRMQYGFPPNLFKVWMWALVPS
ncbi:N-terminal Xaa-Pro-Lys N-methyltransferase 1 [Smittium mucronatum]|uniref:Alpha N-terminal protein methyltransferase 1 n=1 Tax=Smittium mucronatum TaxID=133383 RepID=A0A1R0GML3_9FUNG|nr:N-terminal Xaa-Pro-Lys N-methyltransferase 1 [Smittium mucronatum]